MNKKMDQYACEEIRDRLLRNGAHALPDHELVTLMMGAYADVAGTSALLKTLMALIESDSDGFTLQRLLREQGIDPVHGAQILATVELTRRRVHRQEVRLVSGRDVSHLLHDYAHNGKQHFITLTIDGGSRLIQQRVFSPEGLELTDIHPRDVFADAVADRASGVIVVHNRPGGSFDVDTQTLQMTRRLKDVGKLVDIELIDHVILMKRGFISLRERSLL